MKSAILETTLKIDKMDPLQDKIVIEIDTCVSIENEPLTPNETKDLAFYAGPGREVDFVYIKSDFYECKEAGGGNHRVAGLPHPAPRYIRVQFTDEVGKIDEARWIDLRHGLLLMGRAANDLLPNKIERLFIQNNLPKQAAVSVLVARSRAPLPRLPLKNDG